MSINKDHKRINQRKLAVPCIGNLMRSTALAHWQSLATAHFVLPAFRHLLCILRSRVAGEVAPKHAHVCCT